MKQPVTSALVLKYSTGSEHFFGYVRECEDGTWSVSQNGVSWYGVDVVASKRDVLLLKQRNSQVCFNFIWIGEFRFFHEGSYHPVVYGEEVLKRVFKVGTH